MRATYKKSKINRAVLCACVAALCCLLTGCGASVTVYDYYDNGVRENAIEVSVDKATLSAMEKSALANGANAYTVSRYLAELFGEFDYELEDAEESDGGYAARYVKSFPSDVSDLDLIGTAVEFTASYKDNPFIRKVDLVAQNPFNGVRAAYDDAKPNMIVADDARFKYEVINFIKYGRSAVDEFGETVELFPAITDAFPCLRGENLDGLLLNYVRGGSRRMSSTGTSYRIDSRTSGYIFSRYFDEIEAEIGFSYNRPVSYGWYIVALAAGGAAVGIVFAVTRKKKDKGPTLIDRFPYNPEQYRDYENHLPM